MKTRHAQTHVFHMGNAARNQVFHGDNVIRACIIDKYDCSAQTHVVHLGNAARNHVFHGDNVIRACPTSANHNPSFSEEKCDTIPSVSTAKQKGHPMPASMKPWFLLWKWSSIHWFS